MKCKKCGAEAKGNFCSSCGAQMKQAACPSCGGAAKPGDSFCTQCGATLAGGVKTAPAAGGMGNLGWWMAGGTLLILIMVLGYPVFTQGGGSDSSPAVDPLSGPPPGIVDLSQLSPREAADRLFDRVMRGLSSGDTAGAMGFMPMAINAYQLLDSLDADAQFHLALLQLRNGEAEESLVTSRAGLEQFPGHLLLLSTAGEAAVEVGDDAAAEAFYRTTLEVFDAEVAKQLWEYQAHEGLIPEIRATAEAFLAGR